MSHRSILTGRLWLAVAGQSALLIERLQRVQGGGMDNQMRPSCAKISGRHAAGTWPLRRYNLTPAHLPVWTPLTRWLANLSRPLRCSRAGSPVSKSARPAYAHKTGDSLTLKHMDERLHCHNKAAQPGNARAWNTHLFALLLRLWALA